MCTNCEKKLNLELEEDVSDVVMDFEILHIMSVLIDTRSMGAVEHKKSKLGDSLAL
jgi:hypothetical protein